MDWTQVEMPLVGETHVNSLAGGGWAMGESHRKRPRGSDAVTLRRPCGALGIAGLGGNPEVLHRPRGQLTWGPAGGGRSLAAAMAGSSEVSEEAGGQRSLWS